jgi:hypothetical protein
VPAIRRSVRARSNATGRVVAYLKDCASSEAAPRIRLVYGQFYADRDSDLSGNPPLTDADCG